MPLVSPVKCWRGRSDCISMDSIEGTSQPLTDEQMATLDFDPETFVCAGCIHPEDRSLPQDAYRLCFKNDEVDDMTDNDEQDLAHLGRVIMTSLAIIASQRVNSGKIRVLGRESMLTVDTMQDTSE